MKKSAILFFCAAMASLSVAAQNVVGGNDPKTQLKEIKARRAAELSDMKARHAAELAAMKARQKAELDAFEGKAPVQPAAAKGARFVVEKPQLKNGADTLAYLYGAMQSRGLKDHLAENLDVDTARHIGDFCTALLEQVALDRNQPEIKARLAGMQIGERSITMTKQFSDDYYSADPDKSADPKIFAAGLLAGVLGQHEYTPEQAQKLFIPAIEARQSANQEKKYGENRRAGEKFLAENAKKPGVVTLPSGLQYKVLTEGKGEKPTLTQKVRCHYEGKLVDGTVFDSSYKRGEPTSFGVRQVIKGWTEALQLMPVGSKWELYIPYSLGYGEQGSGQIPPLSALIFTVELISIEN